MAALQRTAGPIQVHGRSVWALVIRLPRGMRLRVDEWKVLDGDRVSVTIPPAPAAPYYVHGSAFVDGAGWWVELVDAPAVEKLPV